MSKLGLIYNPKAKKNKFNSRIKELFEGKGLFRETKTIEDVPEIVHDFQDRGIDFVISSGGDGTFHNILTAYLSNGYSSNLPNFAVLSSGTTNVLAKALGCGGTAEKSLEKIIDNRVDRFAEVTSLSFDSDGKKYLGVIFAAASIYNFVKHYEDPSTGEKSVSKAIRMITKGAFPFSSLSDKIVKTENFDLYIDGKFRGNSHTALLACGFRPNLLKLRPFHWMRKSVDGFYEVDSLLSKIELYSSLINLTRGKAYKKFNYTSDTKEIILKSDSEFGYTIDGELFSARTLKITKGPRVSIAVI